MQIAICLLGLTLCFGAVRFLESKEKSGIFSKKQKSHTKVLKILAPFVEKKHEGNSF